MSELDITTTQKGEDEHDIATSTANQKEAVSLPTGEEATKFPPDTATVTGTELFDVSQQHGGKTSGSTISKSAQKRLDKAALNAQKRAEKLEAGHSIVAEYRTQRLTSIETAGIEASYPHHFPVTLTLAEFRTTFGDAPIENNAFDRTIEHSLAARVMVVRSVGANLHFLDLHSSLGGVDLKVQVIIRKSEFLGQDLAKPRGDEPSLETFMHQTKKGDIIGVKGHPGRSQTGELSLYATSGQLLAPCYHMLPKPNTLQDEETRKRQRYLDLICNTQSRQTFRLRNFCIKTLRNYLDSLGFEEVETPILNLVAGGATARPFLTHHNELNTEMSLRIATELPLKQLVVGGIERVYEIGQVFRNEGIDQTHNPEFTSCEFYWAYQDYLGLMTVTENFLSTLVGQRNTDPRFRTPDHPHYGTLKIDYHVPNTDGTDSAQTQEPIDFTPPYRRLPLIQTIEEEIGKIPRPLIGDAAHEFLLNAVESRGLQLELPHTTKRLIDRLAEEYVESKCWQPTFVTDHPVLMTPLAKWHRGDPELTERFELFVAGRELANAYTELNCPQVQRERFQQQTLDKASGDVEVPPTDADYCTALEYGLPPTAGWGMGMDRLAMLMTGSEKISEVILFPTCKQI